jgi:hypothetical protein
MQRIVTRIGYIIQPSRFVPRFLKYFFETTVFTFIASRIIKNIVLNSELDGYPVFCIVHWNAPDFLLVNIKQIELLYPNSKIYVLDNGSNRANLEVIDEALKGFSNVTLFVAAPKHCNWLSRIGVDRFLYTHTNGLQFLLNYAAQKGDKVVVFLDQDCVLYNKIDTLIDKLGNDILLIGPRYGTLNLVHASFMALQPKVIKELFGNLSFFHFTNSPEPYHGLSLKAMGKILYLETSRHAKISALSAYSNEDKVVAWHAWYSSRTVGCSDDSYLDGVPVIYLRKVREQAVEYMKQIHEEALLHDALPSK